MELESLSHPNAQIARQRFRALLFCAPKLSVYWQVEMGSSGDARSRRSFQLLFAVSQPDLVAIIFGELLRFVNRLRIRYLDTPVE